MPLQEPPLRFLSLRDQRETEALACLPFSFTISKLAADGLIFRICGMLYNVRNLSVVSAFIS